MTTLILTEKPSVARDFAKALGARGKGDGFIEGADLIITWAIGHLVELKEPQDYDPRWKRWSLGSLPILPDQFAYKPLPRTRKQLGIIRRLLKRPLHKVVVATDAGREGEVIARTILMAAGFRRMELVQRFWTSQALTPPVIRETLDRLVPIHTYDRLWNAGQARQIADWLVGMNATRAATKRMGDLFSVGRVQTAVLALLVDRRREREAFVSEPYFLLGARFANQKGSWWGRWFRKSETRLKGEADARVIAGKIAGQTGRVLSVRQQNRTEPPPLLYSLTDLQQDANRRYGLSAKVTLSIAQNLYERKKCLSYPRTDARVLGTRNLEMVQELITTLSGAYSGIFQGIAGERIALSNKRVFNDARLTDHHALIPLKPLPDGASDTEKKIYDLVLRRFAAAFHRDCAFRQTEIITGVAEETFRTRGRQIQDPGWRVLYSDDRPAKPAEDAEESDQPLPELEKGDPAPVTDTKIDKKMTQPPPAYTDALLLKEMTNPGRYVSEEQLKKIYRGDVGLGTQATRAQIIETLLSRQYLVREKKHLLATEKGCRLIDTLRGFHEARILTAPEETARWEMRLEAIARGEGPADRFLSEIRSLVEKIVTEFKAGAENRQPTLGRCPACGGAVLEGAKGYGCENWRQSDGGCSFVIWKRIAGRDISTDLAAQLLQNGRTPVMAGFQSKKGHPFSAALTLAEDGGERKVRFAFPVSPSPSPTPAPPPPGLGTCPACGGTVIEGERGFGCANWRKRDGGCRFVIWKQIAGRPISRETVTTLLTHGTAGPLDGFEDETGTPFSGRLLITRSEGSPPRVSLEAISG